MAKSGQKGLGKGLGALFTEPEPSEISQSPKQLLPIQKLEPNKEQPRQNFDEEALSELAVSIQEHGLIQPIAVRPMENGYYQIIAGERRWRASRLAGLTEVPVHIIEADDQAVAELALIENLQREDLSPIEEARGYEALISKFGMSQETAANRVGKSRTAVTNTLRLLKLPKSIISLIEDNSITAGHARALLSLSDESSQIQAAEKIMHQELTVRQTEALVKRMLKPKTEQKKEDILQVDYYKECEKALSKSLGRGVHIQPGKKKGIFSLEYYGQDDLQQLIEAMESLSKNK